MNVVAPWATLEQLCGPCAGGEEVTGVPDATMQTWLLVATSVLFNLTGQQWPGTQTDIVRPNPMNPAIRGGCGCGQGRRGCSYVSEIQLDGYPVTSVIEVLIDGDVVDEAVYRVDDRMWLVWQADDPVTIAGRARQGWPCCQRQKRPATEDQTFQVEYEWGGAPPPGGDLAAASLACEFSLSCSTSQDTRRKCRLPSRVQSITRQGVTLALIDNLELFAEGRTGIPEVDLWVGSIMVGRERRRSGFIDTQAYALRGRKHRRGPEPVGS